MARAWLWLQKRRLLWPFGISLVSGFACFVLAPSPRVAGGVWLVITILTLGPRLQAARLVGEPSTDKDWIAAETSARQTLIQIVGGAVLLAGAYAAWSQFQNQREQVSVQKAQVDEQKRQFDLQFERQQRQMEEQRKESQAQRDAALARDREDRRRFELQLQKDREAADERRGEFKLQYEAAQSEQVGQRFTRAVDQLGSDRAEVRIAEVRSLEEMARSQPALEWSIQEVLSTWVRSRIPRGTATTNQQFDDLIRSRRPFRLPDDVQRAMTLLASRVWIPPVSAPQATEGEEEWRFRERLRQYRLAFHINLSGIDLRGAFLDNAKLDGADLSGSDLVGGSFGSSSFRDANLSDCDARMTEFSGSVFDGADLSRTTFVDGSLRSSTFRGAILYGTIFLGAQSFLRSEHFAGARVDSTTVIRSDIRDYIEGKPSPSPAPQRPGMNVKPRP